jgi:hypothetical protein
MPEKRTLERARAAKRRGRSPSTQAGEFVREEIHHIRKGKHGAESPEQAIAIGLAKAREAGVKLPPKKRGRATKTRTKGGRSAASRGALSRHAKKAAGKRTASERSASARKAARTKGAAGRKRAAKKAARTRVRS